MAASPLAKYEGADAWAFLDSEGPLAPIPDPATGGYTYRPGDTRPIVTLDGGYQVPAGTNTTFANKIIIVKPVQTKDIEVFGTLTITNSLMLWQQTDSYQTELTIEKGGTLIIKDSYAFSGNQYWVYWEYEDGSTVEFDHFVGEPWTVQHGSLNYSAINYSNVWITLVSQSHDTRIQVSNALSLRFEIKPPAGTYTFKLPTQRQWADWTLSDLWPSTTIEVHDSYIVDWDMTLTPNVHVTVQDSPSGFGLGWEIYKMSPGYVTCELKDVGQFGAAYDEPIYYEDMTWDLPCINASMTVKNSAVETTAPYVWGYVHLKVFDSNLADTGISADEPGLTSRATEEIYDSSILQIFDSGGGRIYVENSQIADLLDVRDPGSVVYGYGVTGPYQVLESGGGAYVSLDKAGPPW